MNKQILNPLGMVGSVEKRPAVYLPSLSDGELITYSESFAGTTLETELTKRLVLALDEKIPSDDGYCQVCGNPV